MRFLLGLLTIMLPLQLAAEPDCTVIDAFERVQFAQLRLAKSSTIVPTSVDALLIIREMKRLDRDKIKFTTRHDLTALDVSRILAFFDMSTALRQALIAKQIDQAQSVFNAPSFVQHINNIKRILPIFRCNPLTDVQGKDGQEYVSSTIKEQKSGQEITIVKVGYSFIGILVAGVLVIQIQRWMTIHFTRKKWRQNATVFI